MAARPTVTVWSAKGESSGSVALPSVFTAPIRLDVVQQVHSECYRGGLVTVGLWVLQYRMVLWNDRTGRVVGTEGREGQRQG